MKNQLNFDFVKPSSLIGNFRSFLKEHPEGTRRRMQDWLRTLDKAHLSTIECMFDIELSHSENIEMINLALAIAAVEALQKRLTQVTYQDPMVYVSRLVFAAHYEKLQRIGWMRRTQKSIGILTDPRPSDCKVTELGRRQFELAERQDLCAWLGSLNGLGKHAVVDSLGTGQMLLH